MIGFLLRSMKYPMAPLVLGIVLGGILDKSFRRGMVLSDGSLEPFFTRPISAALWIATLLVILFSFGITRRALASLFDRLTPKRNRAQDG